MANDLDLIRTPENKEELDRMRAELRNPRYRAFPSHTLAAILWLDQARGVSKPGDYILVDQVFGDQLMYDKLSHMPNQKMSRLWGCGTIYSIEQDLNEFFELARRPFIIRFGWTREDPRVPVNIRGKDVRIAIMGHDEELIVDDQQVSVVTMRRSHRLVDQPRLRREVA